MPMPVSCTSTLTISLGRPRMRTVSRPPSAVNLAPLPTRLPGRVQDRDVVGCTIRDICPSAPHGDINRQKAVAGQRPQRDAEDHCSRRHPLHLGGDDLERLLTRLIADSRQTVWARDDGDGGTRRSLCRGERMRSPEPGGLCGCGGCRRSHKGPIAE